MKTRTTVLCILVAAAALSGCDFVTLQAQSVAPPGAIADVDTGCEEITLSKGVALAIECVDRNQPCEAVSIAVSDPAITQAYPAFSDNFASDYNGTRPASTFVIVGKQVGTTEITVDTSEGEVTYIATVVE